MIHSRTINWETPNSFPADIIALYYMSNNGINEIFELDQVEEKAEYFDQTDGIVFGLIKGFGWPVITYKGRELVCAYSWEEDWTWRGI